MALNDLAEGAFCQKRYIEYTASTFITIPVSLIHPSFNEDIMKTNILRHLDLCKNYSMMVYKATAQNKSFGYTELNTIISQPAA